MEAQIIAIYTPNVNGNKTTVDRYMFLGVFDWLKTPVTRRTDAISLFSKDISWIDKGVEANSNYGLAVSYEKAVYDDNGLFISNEDIDVEFYENAADVTSEKGVYFTYNLPDNNPLAHTVYSSFSFLILGTGMVTNGTTTKYPSVDAEYIHITNPLSLPLNVSWGVVGLDVDALFTPKRYRTHHTWEYKLDYEA